MDKKIELNFDSPTQGGFYIFDGENQLAELEFTLNGDVVNAYHTGVRPQLEGRGIAGRLFDSLIDYARENGYKIKPTCSYVYAKMSKNPEKFADVWAK